MALKIFRTCRTPIDPTTVAVEACTERPARHQAGCSWLQTGSIWSAALAEVPASGDGAGERRSCSGGLRRSAGGGSHAGLAFHPSNGDMTQSIQSTEKPKAVQLRVSRTRAAPMLVVANHSLLGLCRNMRSRHRLGVRRRSGNCSPRGTLPDGVVAETAYEWMLNEGAPS